MKTITQFDSNEINFNQKPKNKTSIYKKTTRQNPQLKKIKCFKLSTMCQQVYIGES